MKLREILRLLSIAALVLFVIPSCVKEGPQGPAGLDGTDGKDGVDGQDGVDGTAFCLDCHNQTNMDAIQTQWAASVHATGGTSARAKTTASCAPCHSAEGFIAYVAYPDAAPVAYPNASQITCEACHSGMHVTFDVENDGPDYALRTKAPVKLVMDPNDQIDFESEANLCVNCHQPRTAYPEPDTEGNFKITSTHYGPHHGPQGTILEGIGFYLFAGTTDIPGRGTNPHIDAGCTTCHMNDGTHTFAPSLDACTQCHGELDDFDYEGVQTEVEELLAQIAAALEAKGVMADGHVVPATYPVDLARAYYNYIGLEEDRSKGVHNPEYVLAVLKNTLESLQ